MQHKEKLSVSDTRGQISTVAIKSLQMGTNYSEANTHLRTDVFCKPLPAFAVHATAQLAKPSLLFMVKVLPEKTCVNFYSDTAII